MGEGPKILERETLVLSPWVTLVSRSLEGEGGRVERYHSFQQADYVTILAETKSGEVVLVRQFRPVLEEYTIELPGGLHEGAHDPVGTATRELEEEAGYRTTTHPFLLGCLAPDSGRLENRFWCFHASDIVPIEGWQPERGVERLLMPKTDFLRAVREGEFTMALHIAIIGLALLQNKLSLD